MLVACGPLYRKQIDRFIEPAMFGHRLCGGGTCNGGSFTPDAVPYGAVRYRNVCEATIRAPYSPYCTELH